MSSVHEQAGAPAAPTPGPGMSESPRGSLAGYRHEFLTLVEAIVRGSRSLLEEARDLGNEGFTADVEAIHKNASRLQTMSAEFFDQDDKDASLIEVIKRLRHDMLNALNVVINNAQMLLEDSEEQFLEAFRDDLQKLEGQGRECLSLLNRIRGLQIGEAAEVAKSEEARDAGMLADALYELETAPLEPSNIEPGYCLVVDDSEQNRDILTRLLLRQGHRVNSAVNGKEALDKIRVEPFDLVFLDIMMPVMNGFQVLQYLKSDEKLRGLPVIMISALDEIDIVARCISMGAEDYLPKPFNTVLLQARIAACLEKKRFRDRETQYLRQIEHEKKRSDELLHVILPGPIVHELKTTNEVRPRRFDNVAVLFADLVGFTSYCDTHSAEEVVMPLQKLVEAWENCAVKHGVEKIKTIGDAFMAAAGLLIAQDNAVLSCVRCGLEMIAETRALPGVKWDLRVGIDLGPVVAGVIGRRQYLFDLWGDTVNTAARMESNGKPGMITLTNRAWERIKHLTDGEPGEVQPKGKTKMNVFRIAGLPHRR